MISPGKPMMRLMILPRDSVLMVGVQHFNGGAVKHGDDVAVLIVIIELIDNADVSVYIGWLHGAADDVDGFEDASE